MNLLKFLEKNYALKDPIWQTNNFVVFPKFFDALRDEENIIEKNNGTSFSAKITEEKRKLYNNEKCLQPSISKVL